MGSVKAYGVASGTLGNGQKFYDIGHAISQLQTTQVAGITLETAVSSALVAAITGTSGAGSMDAPVKATLSASYASITASIF
jgi:hypothetical protein